MTQTSTPNKQRYESIDIAKAFAIILVVIGHFRCTYMPHGYDTMIRVIYMFHMPLFMFASGFLYQATYRDQPYRKFISGKFKRLMIPYFAVSILIICLKLAMKGVMPLDNPVTFMTFVEILYLPSAGYFLWFIWALWWMMVIIPIFRTVLSRQILLAASLILWFISPELPEIFCIKQFGQMLVFFSGGTVVADYMRKNNIGSFSVGSQIISVAVFIALAWARISGFTDGAAPVISSIITLIINVVGIAMSMSLAFRWRRTASDRLLRVSYSVAAYSYLIYLLHTTFEGLAKGVLSKIHWFDYQPQLLTAYIGTIAVICCGVIIPWWLGRYVLNRWSVTSLLFGVPLKKKIIN